MRQQARSFPVDCAQGKPQSADELIRCGMEAVHAHWLAPYVIATVRAAACLVDGKDFASVPPFIWTGAWDSCGARPDVSS